MIVMEIYNDTYCVYAHINKINGKMYVGQTCRKPESRWGRDGSGYREHPYFWHAIQKYGWDNFEHEVIASNLTKEEADNFEKLLIAKLNLLNPNRGYNLQEGGSNGRPSEITLQKMREANSGSKNVKSKKVFQYNLQGDFIKEWDSMTDVAKFYNVGRTTVMRHCRDESIFKDEFILKLTKDTK